MPYTHTSWAGVKSELARRLGDPNKVFWVDEELAGYLAEALRTWNALTGYWRTRHSFNTTPGQSFYDLRTVAPALRGQTVTDRDVIRTMLYHFIEPPNPASDAAWTEMFRMSDFSVALKRRLDLFRIQTGVVVERAEKINIVPPPVGRYEFDMPVADIRRLCWSDFDGEYYPLQKSDENAFRANPDWSLQQGIPKSYSIIASPPLTIQFNPPPQDLGNLDICYIGASPVLSPAVSATPIAIPDDLAGFVKWGAMADVLSSDESSNPELAQFCLQRFQQGVQIARLIPVILNCEVNGRPVQPTTLYSMDTASPSWQGRMGRPEKLAVTGTNLITLSPTPATSPYSITLDLVRNAPVPADEAEHLQLGEEYMDAVVGYAQHLALLKTGFAEIEQALYLADDFAEAADNYNLRLRAASPFAVELKGQSMRHLFTPRLDAPKDPQTVFRGRPPE
jgi:hypothetical protein